MMNRPPDEYTAALRARDGDREALAEIVDHLRLWLFSLAYADLRNYDDAQDAVASALLRICLHTGDLRDPAQMRQWMAAIVRNETHRLARLRARPRAEPLSTSADLSAETASDSLLRLEIDRALRLLPVHQARALALFYLGGIPVREIARRTGRPEGTVKSWLHQGRQRLAHALKEYAPMPDPLTATIISTRLEPSALRTLTEALRAGGWGRVNVVSSYREAATVVRAGSAGLEFHLPAALAGSRFLLLDEWIDGHSAFELLPILNATVERKNLVVGLLVETVTETTSFAAWASGVDLFLDKPVIGSDFRQFAERFRHKLEAAA